jgi:hypothetical protein
MSVQKSVKTSVEKAKAAGRKVVSKLPESTVRGFRDGREAGHEFVDRAPYAAGAAVGFSFGVSEKVVGLIATPVNVMIGWAARAISCGGPMANAANGVADVA